MYTLRSTLLVGITLLSQFFINCTSEVRPLEAAPLFTHHMVLQQKTKVPVWGKGEPGAEVTVRTSWGEEAKTQINSEGLWELALSTKEFGGPHQLIIQSGQQEIRFEDVLLGEVWLASGQSNMEWPLSSRVNNREEELKNANYPQMRMFTVPKNLNGSLSADTEWKVATPEHAKQFSAVGYFFARELFQRLNVPVGIINTSWGGTRVEAWTSIEKLAKMSPSKSEAAEIVHLGGLSALKENYKRVSDSLVRANEKYFNAPSHPLPRNSSELRTLVLNDQSYALPKFDDTDWKEFTAKSGSDETIQFETFFEKGTYAEDGVVWLRKTFEVSDPSAEYTFVVEGGIDDYDFTYLNGRLIGSEFNCCTSRSYTVPKGLLKEKGNVLALRILDTGGEGGFRGSVYLESKGEKFPLDQGNWRLKHHAFYLNSSLQEHGLDYTALVERSKEIQQEVKNSKTLNDPNLYSILFESMIQPLIPYRIKGALWYQGESNVGNHQDYQTLFTGMITDWRTRWKDDFPFYFTQIAPYIYTADAASYALRDAQRKSLSLEGTAMAVTLDIGEEHDIHPANKQDVGLRLARLALHYDYDQKNTIPSGPLYKSQTTHSGYIELTFDHIGSGLVGKNALSGFEIAASEGPFVAAKATIVGDRIRVSSKQIKNPQRVRYGWENYFEASLFNQEGLPASSFETP
ncbi:MAG: sialate O-acetylesterase [Flavobacteriaceae bacterium]